MANVNINSLATGQAVGWSALSQIVDGSADGNIKLSDNAGTAFGLLQLGGTTSSYPAIKRSTTSVEVKLADDSAYTNLTARSATLTGGTVTTSTPLVNATQTWNDGAVLFTGIKLDVNATAHANSSKFIDFQTASTTRFNVYYTNTSIIGATIGAVIIEGNTSAGSTIKNAGSTILSSNNSGALYLHSTTAGVCIGATSVITGDTFLARDAANTLALRNTTNAQTFRVYKSFTDVSNGSWFAINTTTAADTVTIGTTGNGTGASTLSKLIVQVAGTTRLDYNSTTASVWTFSGGITSSSGIIATSSGIRSGQHNTNLDVSVAGVQVKQAAEYSWASATGGLGSSDTAMYRAQAKIVSFCGANSTTGGGWRTLDAGALTIATGAITVTGGYHTVDTESAAASDDLDTISGGVDGMFLVLQAENDARTVVVKHNTGNILVSGAADFSLDSANDTITLMYSGALTKWVALATSSNGT